jgi:hypothetical protein
VTFFYTPFFFFTPFFFIHPFSFLLSKKKNGTKRKNYDLFFKKGTAAKFPFLCSFLIELFSKKFERKTVPKEKIISLAGSIDGLIDRTEQTTKDAAAKDECR